MKIVILEKLDDNTYIVMSEDGQTAITTKKDIDSLIKIGNLNQSELDKFNVG